MTGAETAYGQGGQGVFSTIVVALDGSGTAERGLPLATALSRRDGAKVVLVHVQQLITAAGTVVPVQPDEERIQAHLRELTEGLRDEGIEASLEIRTMALGGAARSIAEVTDEVEADLIIVGTQGHSAMGIMFLGSVTQRLLQTADQPVLVVPAERG